MQENNNLETSHLSRIGLRIILWSIGLSLIGFIPFLPVTLSMSKGIILTLGAIIGMIVYLLDSIYSGSFLLPKSKLWLILISVVISTTLTALFVPGIRQSFIGSGFDFATILTLFTSFVYFFLFSVWGNGINTTKYIVRTFLTTGFIVVLFEIFQIFFNIVGLAPRLFIGLSQSNLIGSFNELALYLGALVMVTAILLENKSLGKLMKVISVITLLVSLALLFLINYRFVWQLVGLFGVTLFIYQIMTNIKKNKSITNDTIENIVSVNNKKKVFSLIAFLLMIFAFIGIIGATSISNLTSQKPFYFLNNEIRPAFVSTVIVLKDSYVKNPITGSGLNRFNQSWESSKSSLLNGKLNASPYWSSSFNSGFSSFLTLLITLGLIPALLFIWFIILLIKKIYTLFSKKTIENAKNKELFIYGGLAIYTAVIFIFNIPSTALNVTIFAFWGMVLAYVDNTNMIPLKRLDFINDSRHTFFSILSIMIVILLLAIGSYHLTRSYYANYLVNKSSLMETSLSNLEKGESYIQTAFNINSIDSYARSLSNIQSLKVIAILNDSSKTEEEKSTLIQENIANSVNSAKNAISLNPKNYLNYLSLLSIQENLIQLGSTDIYEEAIKTADQALLLAPNNLGIIMRQAKIATNLKKYEEASIYLDKILAINIYYIDAYILRSQIYLTNNNSDLALATISKAESLNPRNALLPYQKGLIYSSIGNYKSSAESLEKALRLSPSSLEIYSVLAVTYEKLGNTNATIKTLENAKQYIKDTTEVDALIQRAKNGQSISSASSQPTVKTDTDEKEASSDTIPSTKEKATN